MPPRARKPTPAYQPKRREATIRPAAIPLRGRRLNRGGRPLYKQLLAILRESIVSGSPPVGTPLPREADLAETFQVSLITVRQALRDLETEGLIRKRAAKPAVVTDPSTRLNPTFDFRTFGDIAAFTRNARLEVKSYGKERAGDSDQLLRAVATLTSPCPARCARLAADDPRPRSRPIFRLEIGRQLSSGAFDEPLIFRSVEKHLGIRMTAAQLTVRAETADALLARKLDYETDLPFSRWRFVSDRLTAGLRN